MNVQRALAPRPLRRTAMTAAGCALLSAGAWAPTAAHAAPGGEAAVSSPTVTLAVQDAGADGRHAWSVSFQGEHLHAADGEPSIEWVVDTWAPASGPRPVTVASGAEADPRCDAQQEPAGGATVSSSTAGVHARTLPAGTDRVMVYGAYCATDGSVHRFQLESDVLVDAQGGATVRSWPVEDHPAPDSRRRPEPDGPIVDTGRQAISPAGPSLAVTSAGLAGLGLALAGGSMLRPASRRIDTD